MARTRRAVAAAIPRLAIGAAALVFAPSASAQVTFTRDVAPILFRHCAACHQPDGPGPFSVLTYDDVRRRATQIAAVTRTGVMPPRKAEPGHGDFVGQERLSPSDIATIQKWVDEGIAEGTPSDRPPLPTASRGWQLGVPDLIVRPAAYTLPTEGTDVFRIFVIPLPVGERRFVRGLEFRPGNRVVHHANIRIDRTAASRRFDEEDPAPGYDGLIAHSAGYPDGHFLGWTPGQAAPLLPKGLAWTLQPGSDLVVELHMQPSGKPELVQPSIGFYFGDDPPERTPAMLRLGRQNLDIPPNDSRYTSTDSFVLPVDVEVQAVQPHAHYLAREVRGTARLPDGTTRPLISIKDWDFRWQQVYRYVKPVALPKGTTLAMEIVYDNSAANPRNPSRPPRRVGWGQRSADEMGDLWIQVLTRNARDLPTLNAQFRPKVLAEDVIGYEARIKAEPDSAALHDDAALLYLDLGRPADAVRHFEIAAAMKPNSAPAHFNLGTALTVAGRIDDALAQYRRALTIQPEYAPAHNNLGAILFRLGRLEEAERHLSAAVRIDPANADAHDNLGRLLRDGRRTAAAMDHFAEALRLRPEWAVPHVELAWLLATARDDSLRDPARAVAMALQGAALSSDDDPAVLDVLAAAYAAGGDFERAIQIAEKAVSLATPNEAAGIGQRLALYRQRRPFRSP
jgi:tetratricopeptide (TPR) repeat protein/mono/diheme cytochrome c family protein